MRFGLRLFLGLLLAVLVAGCGRKPPTVASRPSGPRKVVLQTDWFPQAEHGGFYQALAKGYYREAGLEVDIRPGGPGAGIKLKVAKGEADFGMLRSDDLLIAASRGMPLVMVMASMLHDPQALMVHEGSPVKTFRDLDGRVVIGNVGMAWFPFLEKKYGIKIDKRQNTYGLGEFLVDPEAIQQCLVTNEPFFAEEHGQKVRTLPLAETGYDCYHTIFCRRELIQSSPEVVSAFVSASIRGWKDYLDGNPAAADEMILKRNPQMTQALLQFSRSEIILRGLVRGDRAKGEEIGQLSLARLMQQMDALVLMRIMETPVLLPTVFTTDFLPKKSP